MHSLRPLLTTTALLVPSLALALDFSGTHLPYSDVRSGSPEAAAVSLLTSEGVVQGYPDGAFRTQGLLNRAEFLKIVLESHPGTSVSEEDAEDCFPDVAREEWFSTYVCHAKRAGIVAGYPDGHFRPAQNVNHAEALKMLGELYGYSLELREGEEWYAPYHRAAAERGTTLPVSLAFDAALTRGQMSRLAAAFLAESAGLLAEYRRAEQGSFTQPEEPEEEEEQEPEEPEEEEQEPGVPEEEHESEPETALRSSSSILLLGTVSGPLADGMIESKERDEEIRFVRVELLEPVLSIDTLELMTADGLSVAVLRPVFVSVNETYERFYEATIPAGNGYVLKEGTPLHVYVRARLRQPGNRGIAREILRIKQVTIHTVHIPSNTSSQHFLPGVFPRHATSLGRIASVTSEGPISLTLAPGQRQDIATFSFVSQTVTGATVILEHLFFDVSSSKNVHTSNWRLSDADSSFSHSCVTSEGHVECVALPTELGTLSSVPRHFTLHADVSLKDDEEASLQVTLPSNGLSDDRGSLQWNDGTGSYRWVERDEPVATGPLLTR